MKHLLYLSGLLLLLTGCETREDIFSRRNQAPELYLSLSPDLSDTTQSIEMDLRRGDRMQVYFVLSDDQDPAFLEDLQLTYTEIYKGRWDDSYRCDDEGLELYWSQNTITIGYWHREDLDVDDFADKQLRINVTVKDAYQAESKAYIYVTLRGDQAPDVRIQTTACPMVDQYGGISYREGYTYQIDASQSVDPEGDAIVSYEYAFDAESFPEWSERAHRKNSEDTPPVTGGTYIQATSLSSVYHVFQSSGTHKVYVRCLDSWGMWSAWRSCLVRIE